MRAICVDDELFAMKYTVQQCLQLPQIDEVQGFTRSREALDWLKDHEVDLAILDINMPEIDGIELAGRIKQMYPQTAILFLTAYKEYAFDAFSVHPAGYLLKPVSLEELEEEISHAAGDEKSAAQARLQVRCFGYFAVFWKKKPLVFGRKKTLELLTYLVDRGGAPCSAEEAIDVLFETSSEQEDLKKAKQNLRNLVFDLTSVLKQIGQEDILIRTRSTIAICPDRIDCDYYGLLAGNKKNQDEFSGEYMEQYSWAETTKGKIIFQLHRGSEHLPGDAYPGGDSP